MAEKALCVQDLKKAYRLGEYDGSSFRKEAVQKFRTLFGHAQPLPDERFYALDGVSFSAEKGEALGIIGRNGAGKSTLLKVISRITAPTAGTVSINGRVASLLEIGTGFHTELTGRENIFLNGAIMGMSRAETRTRMADILEFSEIEKFIDTPVKRYSSGMSVKLGFAVAANLNPDLLICDEVLAVGDAAFQQKCLNKMSDVAKGGSTVLYVSHNMRTVSQLCSRVICLDHGRITFDGAPETGIERYVGEVTAAGGRCDLSALHREAGLGEHIRLEWAEIMEITEEEYEEDSIAEVCVGLWSDGEFPEIRLRATWVTGDFPVGTSDSGLIPLQMGRHRIRMRLPLEALSTGEYALRLQAVGAHRGNVRLLDGVSQALHVKIREDRGLNLGVYWDLPRWGNVRIKNTLVDRVNP